MARAEVPDRVSAAVQDFRRSRLLVQLAQVLISFLNFVLLAAVLSDDDIGGLLARIAVAGAGCTACLIVEARGASGVCAGHAPDDPVRHRSIAGEAMHLRAVKALSPQEAAGLWVRHRIGMPLFFVGAAALGVVAPYMR